MTTRPGAVHPTRRGSSVLHPGNLMSTRARLYALRRLPRSTAVGIVPIEEEQRLAEELLALPDPVDPVAWLRDQRTPEIARHTLRAALRSYRVINRGPAPLFSGAGLDLDSGAGLDGEALIRALRQVQAKPRWTLRLSIPGAFIDDIHE